MKRLSKYSWTEATHLAVAKNLKVTANLSPPGIPSLIVVSLNVIFRASLFSSSSNKTAIHPHKVS